MGERDNKIPDHVLAAARFLVLDAQDARNLKDWIGDESSGLKPGETLKRASGILEIISILELPRTQ